MKTLIKNGTIVNEGKTFRGYLVVDGEQITHIYNGEEAPRGSFDKTVDASGCFVMPGVIDDHVHFREPGLTAKADIESESRAAAFGGVTSYFDMPNTVPQTTTLEALADKTALGSQKVMSTMPSSTAPPMTMWRVSPSWTVIAFPVSSFSWAPALAICLSTRLSRCAASSRQLTISTYP